MPHLKIATVYNCSVMKFCGIKVCFEPGRFHKMFTIVYVDHIIFSAFKCGVFVVDLVILQVQYLGKSHVTESPYH